jgi:hypothetical protein
MHGSSEEAASIREAIATPGVDVLECPRCEEVLSVRRSPDGELLTLTCEPCRRILVLRREGPLSQPGRFRGGMSQFQQLRSQIEPIYPAVLTSYFNRPSPPLRRVGMLNVRYDPNSADAPILATIGGETYRLTVDDAERRLVPAVHMRAPHRPQEPHGQRTMHGCLPASCASWAALLIGDWGNIVQGQAAPPGDPRWCRIRVVHDDPNHVGYQSLRICWRCRNRS